MDVWLTVQDVMALLGVSDQAVYNHIRSGNFAVRQIEGGRGRGGARYLIALSSLPASAQEKWLERYRETAREAEAAAADPGLETVFASLAEVETAATRDAFERQLAEARRRQEIVQKALAAEGAAGKLAVALEAGISRSTLYNWIKRYIEGGLEGLLDLRLAKGGEPETKHPSIDPEARRFMIGLWLNEDVKPSAAWCYERTLREAETRGWKMCSRATAYRILSEIPRDIVGRGREGKKAFENRYLIKCQRDTERLSPMEVVMADHHQCDFFIDYGGKALRPWLSLYFDVFSRCPVGWAFSVQPNSEVLALAFRHMVLPKPDFPFQGLPKILYLDNGKDMRSRHFRGRRTPVDFCDDHKGILEALQVEVICATEYWAWAKAEIERFFGTFADRFSRFMPGWVGRNKDERPEEADKRVARLLSKKELVRIPELVAQFEAWLKEDYLARVHRTIKVPPLEKYLAKPLARPGAVDPERLDYFLMKAEGRTVTNQGIHFMGHTFYHPDLALKGLIGRQVVVRYDSNRLGELHVFFRGEKICVATNKKLLGIGAGRADVAAWKKEQARHKRAVEEAVFGYRKAVEEVVKEERAKGERAAAGMTGGAADRKVVQLLPGAPKKVRAPREGELVRRYRERLLKELEESTKAKGDST